MPFASFDRPLRTARDEEQTQMISMPQYAGPLRIPSEQFQPRVRDEPFAADAINSRSIEDWNAAVPTQQTDYMRVDAAGLGVFTRERKQRPGQTAQQTYGVPEALQTTYMDMAPLSSRTDKRDFRQSRPFDPTGPGRALNPYFDRYDPVSDPRNTIRELRSVVYELKDAERGSEESARIRQRGFANRYLPEGETQTAITEVHELLRPKIDNPEIVYRNQQTIQSLGAPYGSTS